jgi:hypothetical protein
MDGWREVKEKEANVTPSHIPGGENMALPAIFHRKEARQKIEDSFSRILISLAWGNRPEIHECWRMVTEDGGSGA